MRPCFDRILLTAAMAAILLGASAASAQDDPLNGDPDPVGNDTQFDPGEEKVIGDISADFESFARSGDNADALVRALRTGGEVTLSDNGATTVFDPATGHMGYGEVHISLSLAEALLRDAGITDPTPEQIAAVLNGGDVLAADGTIITYEGILVQRSDGQGWGQIARNAGVNLGLVIASKRSGKDLLNKLPADASRGAGNAQIARERVETAGNAGVTGKPMAARAQRPGRVARSERVERPVQVERPVRIERPVRPERPVKF
ncbi:MAG: hypothetical protein WDZ63_12420 [Burkholderiales bacterium]